MTTTKPKAAAAATIGASLAARKRSELLGLLRPCFVRCGPWLQAGKYLGALAGDLPRRNGQAIAQRAGDRAPLRTQRLLNHLENMALFAGMTPPGGFETFVPTAGDDETGLTVDRPPGGCTRTSSARR